MNKTIYKYPLKLTDLQDTMLPVDASILTVQIQHDKPCLWALVDPEANYMEPVTIRIAGTGHPIVDNDNLHYISTFQMQGGLLVFHVFEVL